MRIWTEARRCPHSPHSADLWRVLFQGAVVPAQKPSRRRLHFLSGASRTSRQTGEPNLVSTASGNCLPQPSAAQRPQTWQKARRHAVRSLATVVDDDQTPQPEFSASESDDGKAATASPHLVSDLSAFKSRDGDIRQYLQDWNKKRRTELGLENSLEDVEAPPSARQTVDDREVEEVQEDDVDFDDLVTLDDGVTVTQDMPHFQVGDLIQIHGKRQVLCVVVRKTPDSVVCYSERGSWFVCFPGRAHFRIANFMSPTLLEPLIACAPLVRAASIPRQMHKGFELEEAPPLGLGQAAAHKMQAFVEATGKLESQARPALDSIYRNRAFDERYMQGSHTYADVTRDVFGKARDDKTTNPLEEYVVFNHLLKLPLMPRDARRPVHGEDLVPFFPNDLLADFAAVAEWMRLWREEQAYGKPVSYTLRKAGLESLKSFIDKARTEVESSRRLRKPGPRGFLGPQLASMSSEQMDQVVTFEDRLDDNERKVLRVFEVTMSMNYFEVLECDDMASLGPMILQSTKLYDYEACAEILPIPIFYKFGWTFLQELGRVTPWHCDILYKSLFGSPGTSLVKRFSQEQISTQSLEVDTMSSFRKEWNDPVFCIDDLSTKEVDDGMSIEPDESDPTSSWLHVHVANPTAFFGPRSPIAEWAAIRETSFYIPGVKLGMFPKDISDKYLSLGNGRPCITFSGKVDKDGELQEYKISHGILNNVIYKTQEQVLAAITGKPTEENTVREILSVGPSELLDQVSDSLSLDRTRELQDTEIASLKELVRVGQLLRRRRERNGGSYFATDYGTEKQWVTKVQTGFPHDQTSSPFADRLSRFNGDPAVRIYQEFKSTEVLAIEDCVSAAMVLAGEICGKWCAKRNIAVAYRSSDSDPQPVIASDQIKEQIASLIARGVQPPRELSADYARSQGRVVISPVPGPHLHSGLPVYVQCTSPLRRFNDALAHWQVEAALRHEAEAKDEPLKMPFDKHAVQRSCRNQSDLRLNIRKIEKAASAWQIMQVFHRAFYFKEAQLPEKYMVRIKPKFLPFYRDLCMGRVEGSNISARIVDLNGIVQAAGITHQDQIWECTLRDVTSGSTPLGMTPLRLVSVEAADGQPA